MFFLFLKHTLESFHDIFHSIDLDTYKQTKESCVHLYSQLFFKIPHEILQKFQKNLRKLHFLAIYRPKFQKISLLFLPLDKPLEPQNEENSSETKSFEKTGC